MSSSLNRTWQSPVIACNTQITSPLCNNTTYLLVGTQSFTYFNFLELKEVLRLWFFKTQKRKYLFFCFVTLLIWVNVSDVTGLGRTRQKPDLDYFFQTETRTRLLRRNPEKPEPDCETRQNPKGFCKD